METRIARVLSFVALSLAFACGGDDDDDDGPGGGEAIPIGKPGAVFALTDDNRLLSFDPGTPDDLITDRPLDGLQPGEEALAIDFRPATGGLYVFTNQARLYQIDVDDADVVLVGTGPLAPPPVGTEFGFDFNPVVDRIRLTSEADENWRLHPDTGVLVAADTDLAYAPTDPNVGTDPSVVAAAYTNAFAGATSTILYALDAELDALVRIGVVPAAPDNPNNGQLTTIGTVGAIDVTNVTGFDISPSGGAYAVITPPAASSRLYLIDLVSGGANQLGIIGGGATVRDVAIQPPSAPRIFALGASGRLISFRPGTADTLLSDQTISDLVGPGETIVAIDVRPATGDLYGVSDQSRLYRIDKDDADAHEVGAGPFAPPLSGTVFGADFDPANDLLRIVGDDDQNLAIDPDTGTVAAADVDLFYAPGDPSDGFDPKVTALGFTSNFSGSTTSTAFGIDPDQDTLVQLGSVGGSPDGADTGSLTTIGALNVFATDATGLDVSTNGSAWAVITAPLSSSTQLYSINLTTGAANLIGTVGGGLPVIDLAVDLPIIALVFGLTTDNRLVSFRPGTPQTLFSNKQITGLQAGEQLVAIDFRPSTSELYALGDSNRLYTIGRSTGQVVLVGTGAFTPGLSGSAFGMDFNPLFDPLRVVGDDGQNLRFSPSSGGVTADTNLTFEPGDPNFGTPVHVTAIAHTNNFTGAASTALFGLDTSLDTLVAIGATGGPNGGLVTTLDPLADDSTDLAGFDISTYGGAFLALQPAIASGSQLHSLNLTTGATTLLGAIAGTTLRDIAVYPSGL